jgi:pre-60S factor REI1
LLSKKHKDAVIATPTKVEKIDLTSTGGDEMEVEPTDSTHINWKIKFAQATSEQEVQELVKQKIETSKRLNVDQDCLFCTHNAKDFDENLDHMTKSHSLFIPDVEFLTDLRGLVDYLAEKVAVANVCLACNGKGKTFHSTEAVRRHMIDRGHTKIAYDDDDDLEELAAFYDFPEETPKAHWDLETRELVLPSGARAGHRQFRHYYNQYIRPTQVVHKPNNLVHKLKGQYKALGWHDSSTSATDVAQIVRAQKRDKMRQAKERMQIGQKSNKTLQTYRRPQVIF